MLLDLWDMENINSVKLDIGKFMEMSQFLMQCTINLVDTYNIDNVHPAELLNIVFLNSMIQNGIKVVKEIK